jgi:hypothetical protein
MVAGAAEKFAVNDLGPSITIVIGLLVPVTDPLHPVNWYPGPGIACT